VGPVSPTSGPLYAPMPARPPACARCAIRIAKRVPKQTSLAHRYKQIWSVLVAYMQHSPCGAIEATLSALAHRPSRVGVATPTHARTHARTQPRPAGRRERAPMAESHCCIALHWRWRARIVSYPRDTISARHCW
jgi:hypothetical protein